MLTQLYQSSTLFDCSKGSQPGEKFGTITKPSDHGFGQSFQGITEDRLQISIPIRSQMANVSAWHEKNYHIVIAYGSWAKWEIHRSHQDILDLHDDLLKIDQNAPRFQSFTDRTQFGNNYFEQFLQQITVYYGDSIWHNPRILEFMDDNFYTLSTTASIRIKRLSEQISFLIHSNKTMTARLELTELKSSCTLDVVQELQKRLAECETRMNGLSGTSGPNTGCVKPSHHYNSNNIHSTTSGSECNTTDETYVATLDSIARRPSNMESVRSCDLDGTVDNDFNASTSSVGDYEGSGSRDDPFQVPNNAQWNNNSSRPQLLPGSRSDLRAPPGLTVVVDNMSSALSITSNESSPNERKHVHVRLQLDSQHQEQDNNNHHHHQQQQQREESQLAEADMRGEVTVTDSCTLALPREDEDDDAAFEDEAYDDGDFCFLASSLAAMPSAAGSSEGVGAPGPWQSLEPSTPDSNDGAAAGNEFSSSHVSSGAASMADPVGLLNEFYVIKPEQRETESLPLSFIPINKIASSCDEVMDDIINMISPHENQVHYRSSAKSFLSKQVRCSLGSKVFETGLHAIKCFLPDDPIRLSAILWPNHAGNWHTHLSERLCRVAEYGKVLDNCDELSDLHLTNSDGNEAISHMEHALCNVTYTASTTQPGDFRIFCMVDSLGAEIASNSRCELCTLAFFEEVSDLVGKDNLFKKSLLLIRAWWVYETTAYIGCPMKHYLSDFTISVMVCAIFNQNHAQIHQPLQALCLFLAEFADIDWASCVITIQGIVPFRPEMESQPWVACPQPGNLLQQTMINKYWDAFNITADSATPDPFADNEDPFISNQIAENAAGETARSISLSVLDDKPAVEVSNVTVTAIVAPVPRKVPCLILTAMSQKAALASFERRYINVLHPLTNTNMMTDKLNIRRAKRISKVFQIGARNMQSTMKLTSGTQGALSVQTPFNNFFRGVITRFGNGWRPDIASNATQRVTPCDTPDAGGSRCSESGSILGEPGMRSRRGSHSTLGDNTTLNDANSETTELFGKDAMSAPLERLWDQILYCNLILEGRLTESALLALSKEILLVRGTLPVGEIGKMLQELTSMATLSAKLKEKFGGLKKFLERFPDQFVISTDHPFNPHVFCRQSLTEEDVEMVIRGAIPQHIMSKFKKMVVVRKKKCVTGNSSVIPTPMDYGPWSGTQNGSMGLSIPYAAAPQSMKKPGMSGPNGMMSMMNGGGGGGGGGSGAFDGGVAKQYMAQQQQQAQYFNNHLHQQQANMGMQLGGGGGIVGGGGGGMGSVGLVNSYATAACSSASMMSQVAAMAPEFTPASASYHQSHIGGPPQGAPRPQRISFAQQQQQLNSRISSNAMESVMYGQQLQQQQQQQQLQQQMQQQQQQQTRSNYPQQFQHYQQQQQQQQRNQLPGVGSGNNNRDSRLGQSFEPALTPNATFAGNLLRR